MTKKIAMSCEDSLTFPKIQGKIFLNEFIE